MSTVEQISQANAATNSSGNSSTTASTADYDAFLNLLVAQMKNQDPTAPTDTGQLIAQLASFSSVEQQIQTNDKLSTLIQTSLLEQAADVIGYTVTSADGSQSGRVVSVTLGDSGLVARLDDGSTMPIVSGVVVEQ